MAEELKDEVWGLGQRLSAQQVRAMPPELVKTSLLATIEQLEAKARELGVEEPDVTVVFLAEFLHVHEKEED